MTASHRTQSRYSSDPRISCATRFPRATSISAGTSWPVVTYDSAAGDWVASPTTLDAAGSALSPRQRRRLEHAAAAEAVAVDLSKYELPEFAKHSLDKIGVFAAGNAAFPADSFGQSDGRFLQVLMRRMDAPIASRWVSIVLRRALMSPLDFLALGRKELARYEDVHVASLELSDEVLGADRGVAEAAPK